ncbi:MAG: hypothetical protein AAF699_06755 [Pseudomonadota bacterium]
MKTLEEAPATRAQHDPKTGGHAAHATADDRRIFERLYPHGSKSKPLCSNRSADNTCDLKPLSNPKTILFVHPDTKTIETAQHVLEYAGYEVLTAKSAAEAWVCFQVNYREIGLLMTDVCRPETDTHLLCERVCAVHHHGTPIPICTFADGTTSSRAIARLESLPGVVHYGRPIDWQHVSDIALVRLAEIESARRNRELDTELPFRHGVQMAAPDLTLI